MRDSPQTGCEWRTIPMWRDNQKQNEHDVYCCLVPPREALRTCCSAFPITTKSHLHQEVKVVPSTTFTKRTYNGCGSVQKQRDVVATSRLALQVWCSYAQYMKITRDEHVLGFKCCNISIYWWIWMLSILIKHIWIGIDDFRLNFFATFDSVLGLQIAVTFGSVLWLQVTVGLQVNSGLQPPSCWEPFLTVTMLRRHELTKERVELTILSIIAIEITHLTRFYFLLLLRILRYMWRNHVATWV